MGQRALALGSVILRPHVQAALESEPYVDEAGWRHPRRLGMMTFMRSIPGLPSQFRAIPSNFWSEDVNEDGFTEAIISCPCGDEPHVEIGSVVECKCERFFFNAGVKVLVANSPVDQRQGEEPTPETQQHADALSG
jgi:hypothetical protein